MTSQSSIFSEYYTEIPFKDRFITQPEKAITVIIPIIHTNELWKANLTSIFREIPVAELIIGDGGCVDDSIEVAKKFPRVRVLNHTKFNSLGFSIKNMIEEVKTDWFAYLHSDVYLPKDWFDKMYLNQRKYDWFGCRMQHTIMIDYDLDYGPRPYAGAQVGRKKIFEPNLHLIEDDFVYRQEDFVFSDIVKKSGGIEGRIDDVFHYHQTMHKHSPTGRKVKSVKVAMEMNESEQKRTAEHQLKGIVKYLTPDIVWAKDTAINCFDSLITQKMLKRSDIEGWINLTTPAWLPVIKKGEAKRRHKRIIRNVVRYIRRLVSA